MSDDGMMGVEEFCHRFVEPMAEESDHIQAIALTDALGLAVGYPSSLAPPKQISTGSIPSAASRVQCSKPTLLANLARQPRWQRV